MIKITLKKVPVHMVNKPNLLAIVKGGMFTNTEFLQTTTATATTSVTNKWLNEENNGWMRSF